MLDKRREILLVNRMINSPDKKFHVNELHAYLKLNAKILTMENSNL